MPTGEAFVFLMWTARHYAVIIGRRTSPSPNRWQNKVKENIQTINNINNKSFCIAGSNLECDRMTMNNGCGTFVWITGPFKSWWKIRGKCNIMIKYVCQLLTLLLIKCQYIVRKKVGIAVPHLIWIMALEFSLDVAKWQWVGLVRVMDRRTH